MSGISAGEMIDGRYRVISRVGAGGMADVFLAEDQQLRRNVALKLLHRRFAEDPGFVERFRREAQAAASLQHPNVVSVFDRGGFDGTYYIAMEYLQGRSLKALIRQEAPLDPVRAIDITIQILKATRFAHRRGVIHRDLKPHNVIIDDQDHAKVTDFGIARAGASDMTETGSIMGTAQYLSPEQAQGHAVSEASDLYSIGVVLYEMLTARVPFDAESAVTIALKHVSEAPVPPSRLNPAIPQALEQVVLWVLNKNPADRPADADQFLSVLEQVRESILAGGGGQVTASMAAVAARGQIPSAAPIAVAAPPTTALVAYEGPRAPVLTGDTAMVNGGGPPPRDPDDGGNPWPWVAAFLILLLLAGGGVAAYLLTRPAPRVRVPTVVNLTESSAQTAVQNAGLYANILPENSSAPVNQVIGQYPLGGAHVAKGSTVSLSVSEGPGDVNVPSIVGLKQPAAQRQLELAGLTVGKVLGQSSSTVGRGRVVATSPLAGQQVIKGYGVTLYISTGKGPANVPDVTGDTVAAAKSLLSGAGFKVKVTPQPSTTDQPGDVISQLPAGSSSTTYGSTVTLTVATAPTTAQVPPVVGFTAQAASSALTSAGFKVTTSTKIVTKQNQDGLVVSESPRSGSTAKKGSTVSLMVGTFVPPPITTTTSGSTTTTPASTTTGPSSTTTTTPAPDLTPTTTTTTIPTTPTTPASTGTTTTPTTATTTTGTTTTGTTTGQ